MSMWWGAWLFVLELALIVGSCLLFHERGYKRGKEEGYKLGRIDENNWWLGAEQQADQARQKIWQQEPKSGKGK